VSSSFRKLAAKGRLPCYLTLLDWSLFSGAAFETERDDIWSNKDWGLGEMERGDVSKMDASARPKKMEVNTPQPENMSQERFF
ncbi:hypothetical protein OS493_029357, partial [Desmophyllum pertusum]